MVSYEEIKKRVRHGEGEEKVSVVHLPDALSPQTLHATKVFVPVDELDELESAADDVAVVTLDDEVGENGWLSASEKKSWRSFSSRPRFVIYFGVQRARDNWK
jgi:hypothetical protein